MENAHVQTEVTPYGQTGETKKQQVAKMFDSIAPRYDLLNRSLSLGIDVLWRKRLIATLRDARPQAILDVATGTGDVALEALSLGPQRIVGLDLSPGMLELGRQKVAARGKQGIIEMMVGDSEQLPFGDNIYDAVTVAFGVRNFENLPKGLREIARVLKPGGKLAVLEFSRPRTFPVKQLYWFYFDRILPLFGRAVSKDSSAYSYLPESVRHFPDGDAFLSELRKAGFREVAQRPLTFGIATIYTGIKA